MNSFDTLLFPDTNIFTENYYSLLLFCSPLHYLQPVEPGLKSDVYDEYHLFLESGLCEGHTSVPPGYNSDRFSNLLHTIMKSKDKYATQVSATAKSSISDEDGNSLSLLIREHCLNDTTTEGELELWRARLLLAIADIYDLQENDLREELQLLSEDEIAVLRSLPEKNGLNMESSYDEVENIVQLLEKSQEINTKKRFEAWLCLLRHQALPSIELWLASSRDSGDQIFQKYKTAGKGDVVPLLKLALPAYIAASGKYVVKQIEAFHQATNRIHLGLVADFERIATTIPYLGGSRESLLPFGTDWAERWEFALDDHFPSSSNGRKSITFYLLPDQPVAQLLLTPEKVNTGHNQYVHGLLGIVDEVL